MTELGPDLVERRSVGQQLVFGGTCTRWSGKGDDILRGWHQTDMATSGRGQRHRARIKELFVWNIRTISTQLFGISAQLDGITFK
jgi:hypothetical protein